MTEKKKARLIVHVSFFISEEFDITLFDFFPCGVRFFI